MDTGPIATRTPTSTMTIPRIRNLLAAFLVAALPALADDYPSKPIKVIVPYAPGGGADLVARLVGQQLSERLKQPVVVENQGGGSNTIGMGSVKRSDPDGYTLGPATPGFRVAAPGLEAEPYGPFGGFPPGGL